MGARIISLTQNPDINFLTTKQVEKGIEISGETSFELTIGDLFIHPYFKDRKAITHIIETRKSHDVPDRIFYRVIVN